MTSLATALAEIPAAVRTQRILVVEQDKATQAELQQLFHLEGYGVQIASTAEEGLKFLCTAPPSAVILDLESAGASRRQLFEKMYFFNPGLPILLLGATSSAMERVWFLELGAEDYVVKPFHHRELVARLRAVMRRSQGWGGETFAFGDVRVDFRRMEVQRQGRLVALTAQEFKVLMFMSRNAERPISREELLNEVWGYQNYPTTRTVDNHILKLRQKLEPDPSEPVHFITVHCVGYRFVPNAVTAILM